MGTIQASVDDICSRDLAERVRINQSRLLSEMKSRQKVSKVVPILAWLPVSHRLRLLIKAHQLGICDRSLN
jgi:hypothetical protein